MNPSILKSNKIRSEKTCDIALKTGIKEIGSIRQEGQNKIKTELCRNLEAGFCEFGDKCFFAHSIEELRDKSRAAACKLVKCKNFFELGYCLNGHKCQYRHRESSPDTAANSPNVSAKASRKGSEDTHKVPFFLDFEFRNLF